MTGSERRTVGIVDGSILFLLSGALARSLARWHDCGLPTRARVRSVGWIGAYTRPPAARHTRGREA